MSTTTGERLAYELTNLRLLHFFLQGALVLLDRRRLRSTPDQKEMRQAIMSSIEHLGGRDQKTGSFSTAICVNCIYIISYNSIRADETIPTHIFVKLAEGLEGGFAIGQDLCLYAWKWIVQIPRACT